MQHLVTSLPVSKELAELMPGVEYNFAYTRTRALNPDNTYGDWGDWRFSMSSKGIESWWCQKDRRELVPAYTLTEILRVLPMEIEGYWLDLNYLKYANDEYTRVVGGYVSRSLKNMRGHKKSNERLTPENAAKLCIWTIKEGYLKTTDGGG
ncbi:MAG: hypothetical protein ACYSSI_13000 [Planctomycetota bacterium]|jgi:hypothetical protein